jgi:hypothetical protein
MPLSSLPTSGPTIPAGAQKVSLKDIDVASSTAKEDVTDLADEERQYADPPLRDGGANAATATCSASGVYKSGTTLAITAETTTTGWICEDYEITREVGKYATWSANWSYYPD